MCYYSCMTRALLALEEHPRLILSHLRSIHPTQKWNLARANAMVKERDRSWVSRSMLVIAWQSAGGALDVSSINLTC